VPGWGHKPAVVYHPKKNGLHTTACEPAVLNTRKVGVTLAAAYDNKLRAETWINERRCREVDARIIDSISNNRPVEASTTFHVEAVYEDGKWNDKPYKLRVTRLTPDHLAILPDLRGAYSVKDGGGLLANAAREPERTAGILRRGVEHALKAVGASVVANELSFSDVTRQLSDLLASKFGEPGKYWDGWICDTYDGYVIFLDKGQWWMIQYTVRGDEVSLSGEAEAVVRETAYRTAGGSYVGNASGGLDFQQKEISGMAFDRKKHVDALIANGVYPEARRAELEKTPDAILEGIKVPEKKEATVVANSTTNEATITTPAEVRAAAKTYTLGELLANASPEERYEWDQMKKATAKRKEALVKTIMGNEKNVFSKEYLDSVKDMEFLEGLAAVCGTPENSAPAMFQPHYAGAAGAVVANATPYDEDPPVMPDVNYSAAK
jgi:hypothetical protein